MIRSCQIQSYTIRKCIYSNLPYCQFQGDTINSLSVYNLQDRNDIEMIVQSLVFNMSPSLPIHVTSTCLLSSYTKRNTSYYGTSWARGRTLKGVLDCTEFSQSTMHLLTLIYVNLKFIWED